MPLLREANLNGDHHQDVIKIAGKITQQHRRAGLPTRQPDLHHLQREIPRDLPARFHHQGPHQHNASIRVHITLDGLHLAQMHQPEKRGSQAPGSPAYELERKNERGSEILRKQEQF